MGACSSIYDVPRPNPKDREINLCTPQAISSDDITNNTNLSNAIVPAKYYCNDETNNPILVEGFNPMASLASQDPAKYGTLLYKEILSSLDKNMNPANANRTYTGPGSAKLLEEINASGILAYITYTASVTFITAISLVIERAGTSFWKQIIQMFLDDEGRAFIGKAMGFAGDAVAFAAKWAASFILNPIKTVVILTKNLLVAGAKGLLRGAKALAGKISPTSAGTDAADAGEDAAKAAAKAGGEDVGEEGAEIVGESILDSIPGIGELALVGQLLYTIVEASIDAIGATTIKYETAYCNNIGDRFPGDKPTDTEWTVFDNHFEKRACGFNDRHRGYKTKARAGCCTKGDCVIAGSGLRCVRQNFRADPFVCCFNDYACNGAEDEDSCFQTPARQRTCHPLFRDLSTNYCRDIIFDYCTGDELLPTQNDWLEMWLEDSFVQINSKMAVSNLTTVAGHYNDSENINERGIRYPLPQKQPCLRAIARAITTSKVCNWEQLQKINVVEGAINSEGFVWSKNLINKVFKKYTDEGGSFLGGINTDGLNRDSSFYNTMWKICNQVPGLCTDILNDMCNGYTATEIATNPFLTPWCSCYLQDSEYQKYEAFGIDRECSPLCNRTGVIPSVSATGQSNICQQTICVLDDTSVDLINTTFEGGEINFNQICGSCGRSNVKQYYDFGNITVNDKISTNFVIQPPSQNILGQYTQVYGSGFNPTKNNQEVSLMIPKGDFDKSSNKDFSKNIDNYYKCVLQYAQNIDTLFVGIVSIVILAPESGNLPHDLNTTITYSLGISAVDGTTKLYNEIINGKPGEVTLITTNTRGSTIVSHNSTTYGQAGYDASVNACQCITSGFSLKTLNSKISGSINFDQECGSSQCFNEDSQPIPCSSTSESDAVINTIENIENEVINELEQNKLYSMFFIIIALIVVLILFYIYRYFSRACYQVLDLLLKVFTTQLNPKTQ
tara:strand:- start:7914 stop:10790 length:2877 start_codon:yes stop_codon:yes gene_type:complete